MNPTLQIDGEPATAEALAHQALVNYGAYTSFRVDGGGARGLDLHLARLNQAALALFDTVVPEADLRELMRRALGDRETAWLRVSLFSTEISNRDPTWVGRPRVMVGVFDPPPPLAASVSLQVQTHARIEARLKHAANMDLLRARRRARAAGFDDALFADVEGRVSEGTLWNIGFVDGETITWPQAPMLAGVAQAVLRQGLAGVGLSDQVRPVQVGELGRFDAAFICNSATPACPVSAIDGWPLAMRPDVIERLKAVWSAAPLQLL